MPDGSRLSLSVQWAWQHAGQLELSAGKLAFPPTPRAAGIYRMTLFDAAQQRLGAYVGETDELPRRFQHYRTPGPSQQTNVRMNEIIVRSLLLGGQVMIDIVTEAQVVLPDGTSTTLDLTDKAARTLVERAVEVVERAGRGSMYNR